MSDPVVITVGPTGGVTTVDQNPNLPVNPEDIAAQVAEAYDEGASVASLHFRHPDGTPTADLGIARATVEAVQDSCPILIQVSTGVSIDTGHDERLRLLELAPRMATFSPCSMTFGEAEFRNPPSFVRELARRMLDGGVKPELEIYDFGHLDAALRLADEGLLQEPLQFGIVLGVRGGMAPTVRNLVRMVDALPTDSVWQAIGIGRHNFDLAAVAIALGGNVRTGLEDNVYLRQGELAPNNAALVAKAVGICRALDRRPSTVEEAFQTLGLAAES